MGGLRETTLKTASSGDIRIHEKDGKVHFHFKNGEKVEAKTSAFYADWTVFKSNVSDNRASFKIESGLHTMTVSYTNGDVDIKLEAIKRPVFDALDKFATGQ